jgi:phosphatidylglycerophosphate synthase
MIDQISRPIKDKLLNPFGNLLGKFISPNQMTLLAFLLGVVVCWFVLQGEYLWALGFWGLNRVTDGLDGTIARLKNQQTDFGGYLDLLLDFIVYAAIPLAFYFHLKEQLVYEKSSALGLALGIMLSVFYINAASWMVLSAILEKKQSSAYQGTTTIRMPTGVIEGAETILVYSLFFIFPGYLVFLFYILSFATSLGILQRLIWAYRNL